MLKIITSLSWLMKLKNLISSDSESGKYKPILYVLVGFVLAWGIRACDVTEAKEEGIKLERAAWEGRLFELTQAHDKEIASIEASNEMANALLTARLEKLQDEYVKTTAENVKLKDDAIALADRGTFSVPVNTPQKCVSETGDSFGGATGDPRDSIGSGTRAELSKEASRFFISEAHRADRAREKLQLCQQVILEYRSVVKAYNEKIKQHRKDE